MVIAVASARGKDIFIVGYFRISHQFQTIRNENKPLARHIEDAAVCFTLLFGKTNYSVYVFIFYAILHIFTKKFAKKSVFLFINKGQYREFILFAKMQKTIPKSIIQAEKLLPGNYFFSLSPTNNPLQGIVEKPKETA